MKSQSLLVWWGCQIFCLLVYYQNECQHRGNDVHAVTRRMLRLHLNIIFQEELFNDLITCQKRLTEGSCKDFSLLFFSIWKTKNKDLILQYGVLKPMHFIEILLNIKTILNLLYLFASSIILITNFVIVIIHRLNPICSNFGKGGCLH